MATAMERIQLRYPIDGTNQEITRQADRAIAATLTPGLIGVLDANGLLVLCNAGATAAHRVQPVQWINIDVSKRGDSMNAIVNRDGSRRAAVDCYHGAGLILRLLVSEVFEAGSAPALGDYVIKSTVTAGKLAAVTSTELAALVPGTIAAQDVHGMVVGAVVSVPDAEGFVEIRTY